MTCPLTGRSTVRTAVSSCPLTRGGLRRRLSDNAVWQQTPEIAASTRDAGRLRLGTGSEGTAAGRPATFGAAWTCSRRTQGSALLAQQTTSDFVADDFETT